MRNVLKSTELFIEVLSLQKQRNMNRAEVMASWKEDAMSWKEGT